jgi:ABC-2 type transport system ATP-binding protein
VAIGRLHTARIRALTVTPPSLDALFLHTYGKALDANETGETLAEAAR